MAWFGKYSAVLSHGGGSGGGLGEGGGGEGEGGGGEGDGGGGEGGEGGSGGAEGGAGGGGHVPETQLEPYSESKADSPAQAQRMSSLFASDNADVPPKVPDMPE